MGVLKASMIKVEPVMNEVLASGGEFRIIIKGTSMLPLLRQGRDSVVVKKEKPEKHDVVLYKRKNGAFVLHRIIGKREKGFILCGDNQFVKEYGIGPDDIIAVVSYIIREDRIITKKSFKYRLYVHTLVFRRFFKRLKFVVRRVVKG
jgi:signal peptidase I